MIALQSFVGGKPITSPFEAVHQIRALAFLLVTPHSSIVLWPSNLIPPLPQTLSEHSSNLFIFESGYTAIESDFLEEGTFKSARWTSYFEPYVSAPS